MTPPTAKGVGRPLRVTDAQMIEFLTRRPGATVEDIRTHFGCKSYTTIANRLTLLVQRGTLWRNTTMPYSYYVRLAVAA